MFDDSAVLLRNTRQESRHVLESNDRNVEGVAEPYKACRFERRVYIQHARQHRRLICDDTDAITAQMRKATDDVRAVIALHFVEHAVVDDEAYHLVHVVRLVRIVGHDVEQLLIAAIAWVGRFAPWRIIDIVRRDEAKQIANRLQARRLGIECEVRDSGRSGVRVGAPEVLHRHVLVCHRLHHVRPGDKHVRAATHHVGEVGDRRRIHGASGTRS